MSVALPLEFKVVEREIPDLESSTSKSGLRRGKIKEHDTPKWVSLWMPWENYMDVTGFVRNLKRELAAVGLATRGEVERDLKARIAEANILEPPRQTNEEEVLQPKVSSTPIHSRSEHYSSSSRSKRSRRYQHVLEDDEEEEEEEEEDEGEEGFFPPKSSSARPSSYRTRSGGAPTEELLDLDAISEKKPPRSASKPMKNCVNCQFSMPLSKQVCPECSTPNPNPQKKRTPPAAPGVLGKGKKFCKHCSAVIASSKRECPVCGAPCVGKN